MLQNYIGEEILSTEKYLNRIGYNEPIKNDIQTLSALQESHLYTVPYENLDIINEKKLSLDIPDLYQKIVINRRGGYCFELNALFGWLLQQLSFPVTSFMSRFLRDEQSIPMRRHHVLKVEVQGLSYLCDVGVGGSIPKKPMALIEGQELKESHGCFRLTKDSFLGWVLEEFRHDQWSRLYSFTEEPQLPIDFIMPSYYCEHAPESIFRQQAKVSILTPQGRHTVAGNEFRIYTPEGVHTFIPESEDAYKDALKKYFNIVL